MPTALEYRAALSVVTEAAGETVLDSLASATGDPVIERAFLLDTVPGVIDYYALGAAGLAADAYEDARETAGVRTGFAAVTVTADRTVKIRRAVAWASEPLWQDDKETTAKRLQAIVQPEVANPYRDTILGNRARDPESVGWRRIARAGACRFCLMLAARGAVYKRGTVRFAGHSHCHCTAEPVFDTGEPIFEASEIQYRASAKKQTPASRARLKDYLDTYYPL